MKFIFLLTKNCFRFPIFYFLAMIIIQKETALYEIIILVITIIVNSLIKTNNDFSKVGSQSFYHISNSFMFFMEENQK